MEKKYKPYEVNVSTLGFYIDRLLYAMIKSRSNDLKELHSDLQHSEFVVLKILSIVGGASQSQLAGIMVKERAGISRLVASLEKKGYVSRKPLNGSTNYVTLTEKGEEYIPMIKDLSEKLEERAFKGFTPKSRETVLKYLHRIYNNFKQEND